MRFINSNSINIAKNYVTQVLTKYQHFFLTNIVTSQKLLKTIRYPFHTLGII